MRYRSIFAYAGRLRAQGNDMIVAGLRQRGVEGIVPSHGDIMHVLLRRKSCSLSELAGRIGRTKSTVTVLVRKLEKAGYVRRAPDPADARGVRISLTERGRALEPAFREISDELEKYIRERLTDEEAARLEALLARCAGIAEDGDGVVGESGGKPGRFR